jgi:GNAT superfamily N-acetyltransferase
MILGNVFWHALAGEQSNIALGSGAARRYARGFSPMLGFADQHAPDFAAVTPHCDLDEHFYVQGWSGSAPDGWQVEIDASMFLMTWKREMPAHDEAAEAMALHAGHAEEMVALATLTNPGPFGPRTLEMGEYFGLFEDGRLIAMAGERMHAGRYREVSGVCTHPDFQGRGLARRLTLKVLRRQMQRGQVPFLHVMSHNSGAHTLYQRLGFVDFHETVVRVVSRR